MLPILLFPNLNTGPSAGTQCPHLRSIPGVYRSQLNCRKQKDVLLQSLSYFHSTVLLPLPRNLPKYIIDSPLLKWEMLNMK